jgi:magnesium transporter
VAVDSGRSGLLAASPYELASEANRTPSDVDFSFCWREAGFARGKRTSLAGQSTSLAGQSTSLAGQSTSLAGQSTSLAGQSTSLAGQSTSLAGQSTSLAGKRAALGACRSASAILAPVAILFPHPDGDLSAATWIDLLAPTAEESARVEKATGLRVPTENQVSEIESTSRLAFEKGAYYVSTPLVAAREDGTHELAPVGFVLSSRVLITVRFASLPAFDAAHELCARHPPETAEDAFLRILEVVVDRAADKLERAGADCDELARSAFRRSGPRAKAATNLNTSLLRVGEVADRSARIRDALLGLGRIGAYVMESGLERAPPVNALRMKAIRADVASLTDYEAHLAGKVQFLLDATLGFINIEQNEIVKTLTIASVVGIPPVLIAGIYGMNFHFMPELDWHFGYPIALAAIVVSALLPFWWFKIRGWR